MNCLHSLCYSVAYAYLNRQPLKNDDYKSRIMKSKLHKGVQCIERPDEKHEQNGQRNTTDLHSVQLKKKRENFAKARNAAEEVLTLQIEDQE